MFDKQDTFREFLLSLLNQAPHKETPGIYLHHHPCLHFVFADMFAS
jgi:hypothetical protein